MSSQTPNTKPKPSPSPLVPRGPPKYGFHPSIDRGFQLAIELPLALGATAIQLWMGNNKGYASKMIPEKIYAPVAQIVAENDVFLIAHSPYILNFARPLQEPSEEFGRAALERYQRDLINITNLGGIGSVLHMGSNVKELNKTTPNCYKQFVNNLKWIIERKPPSAIIILENMAGGGTRMCCKMAEWADFWNKYVDDNIKPHIKWCIDTAHLYATGEYDLSLRTEALRFYRDFDKTIGWEHVLCIHFNGSETALGSHHDAHADIGPKMSGVIQTKGLRQLAVIAGRTGKPLILETPMDCIPITRQFQIIDSWFKGASQKNP